MVKVGDRVLDRVAGLGVGEVTRIGPSLMTVRFGSGDEARIADRLRTEIAIAGEAYLDARGALMETMGWSEALELVHELASSNQIDENDIAFGDAGLAGQRIWQEQALDTLHDLVVNHAERIDDAFPLPLQAETWPMEVWQADRAMSPESAVEAIKIALDLARDAALDSREAARDPDLAEVADRQQQAFSLVQDLLGLYGEDLSRRISAVPLP